MAKVWHVRRLPHALGMGCALGNRRWDEAVQRHSGEQLWNSRKEGRAHLTSMEFSFLGGSLRQDRVGSAGRVALRRF